MVNFLPISLFDLYEKWPVNTFMHHRISASRAPFDFAVESAIIMVLDVEGQVLSKLDSPKTSEEILTFPHRNLIGSLSFIAIRTRPDIMYAVNVLSQFQSNPGMKHWNCLLRLLGYLKYTQDYKLELSKIKSLKLRCYSDSDFASNRDDRVSMGGFIIFIDETPISWRTFKQKSVSLSTMEAEYVSLTEAANEFFWLKNVQRLVGTQDNNVEKATHATVDPHSISDVPQHRLKLPKSIAKLEERFGREDLLVQIYVRDLLTMVMKNAASGPSKTDLPALYDELEGKISALESLGRTQEKYSEFLCLFVESCLPEEILPEEILLAWERSQNERSLSETKDPRTLEVLMNFIRQEVKGEQMINLARAGFGPQPGCRRRDNYRIHNEQLQPIESTTASALVSLQTQDKKVQNCIFL
ncbi:Secreted RxLR effector protein 161 like protein [Argiope bruennichi]|uniref:Secreted RxLR effector protein 161 like protein n=1 Tax=Argiope bruennichi TaxID=94029 RepID=A0A8T0F3L1_ARGBR|nr:Secreted RxLR effector protein 161 like protein [Argiope bruennichi]